MANGSSRYGEPNGMDMRVPHRENILKSKPPVQNDGESPGRKRRAQTASPWNMYDDKATMMKVGGISARDRKNAPITKLLPTGLRPPYFRAPPLLYRPLCCPEANGGPSQQTI